MRPSRLCSLAAVAAALTMAVLPATHAAAIPAEGDFSGMVDIGGRSVYLECRGQGSPTVILESGAGARGDVWSRDGKQPAGQRTMVLPGVASFTRVCAYDRPGTIGEVNPDLDPGGPEFYPSRSDPVAQPRTVVERVGDVHAMLRAANIPGPYVLVAHSAGGLIDRLYASTYPEEVVGMVLVDSTNDDIWKRFHAILTPEQWAEFETLTLDDSELLAAYPAAERWFTAPMLDMPTIAPVTQARRDAPLRPMPLVVLAHGIPFEAPFPGWPTDRMEDSMFAAQEDLAGLVPDSRLMTAAQSGHNVHQDQPELVIDAVRQVVTAVRDPATW